MTDYSALLKCLNLRVQWIRLQFKLSLNYLTTCNHYNDNANCLKSISTAHILKSSKFIMDTISSKYLLQLIEAGTQAPSADNCQPWKFHLLENGFELWLDPINMGLFFDVKQVATEMSCGALIENIVILAKTLGLKAHINYFEIPYNDNTTLKNAIKFAQITFNANASQDNVKVAKQTIFNRHTSRSLFQFNKKIPANLTTELSNIVQSNENYLFHVYQQPKERKAIIQTITATETIRFIHQQIHSDFYKVLRFGSAALETRDGLSAATLGIESFMLPILKLLRSWKLTQLLNNIGLHKIMAFRGTWLPLKSASQIVSIIHKGPANYVESGRVMQRYWLHANKLGLSVQALSALPLFHARLHLAQDKGFTESQLKTLYKLEENFVKITPEFNKETDQIIMIFRVGYEKKAAEKSYRRKIKSFLI